MTSQDGERERERGMEREGEREECARVREEVTSVSTSDTEFDL